MAYFSIRCCSPNLRKILLLILNILIACCSTVHLGYAGSYSIVKLKSIQYMTLLSIASEQISILTNGPLAYYALAGVVGLFVSVFMILVILEIVGRQNRVYYFKLIAMLLTLHLLLEFGAVVYSTIMLPYYALKFKAQINFSQDLIDAQPLQVVKDYYNGVRNFYKLTQAQVIAIWVLIIPTLAVMIYSLFEEFFKNLQPQEPTKIAPQRLQTQQKSKIYERSQTQVQSFGVQSFGSVKKSQEYINIKK